ncbi:MAG: hypothetical protein ABSG36_14850 [Acidimicrobiales bacterium]
MTTEERLNRLEVGLWYLGCCITGEHNPVVVEQAFGGVVPQEARELAGILAEIRSEHARSSTRVSTTAA